MKKMIKQLIPPIIANLFKKTPSKKFTYEGIFQSFSEVKNSENYNVDILQNHLFDLTNTNLEAYKLSNPLPNINFRSPVSNLFSLLISSYSSTNSKTRILDYGGAMGLSFIEASNTFDTSKLDYIILDYPEITNKAHSLTKEFTNLKYINSLDEINETDIVHFGSSIQYLEDYRKSFEEITLLNPKIIFIANTVFSTRNTFATSQNNLYGLKIPMWIFNISEIEALFDELNFELIHKSSNIEPGRLVVSEEFPNLRPLNLLFKRK